MQLDSIKDLIDTMEYIHIRIVQYKVYVRIKIDSKMNTQKLT